MTQKVLQRLPFDITLRTFVFPISISDAMSLSLSGTSIFAHLFFRLAIVNDIVLANLLIRESADNRHISNRVQHNPLNSYG